MVMLTGNLKSTVSRTSRWTRKEKASNLLGACRVKKGKNPLLITFMKRKGFFFFVLVIERKELLVNIYFDKVLMCIYQDTHATVTNFC